MSSPDSLSPPIQPSTYLRRAFLQYVPQAFVRDIIRSVLWAYRKAHEVCQENLDQPEVHGGVGDLRRLLVEGALRGVARRHGGESKARRNTPGTAFYTYVKFGDLALTHSPVSIPGKLRRTADFRLELNQSPQTAFAFMPAKQVVKPDNYYAIIYHGQYDEHKKAKDFNPLVPEFFGIMFPDAECDGAVECIDLTTQMLNEIESYRTADVEEAGELDLVFTAKTGEKIDEGEE